MAILEILTFPDPRLRRKSEKVSKVTPEMQKLVEDMLETMYASRGIGLAAPQVNHPIRLLVIDVRPKENGRYTIDDMTDLEKAIPMPFVIFNPEILSEVGSTTYDEGCLSVPSFFETVERSEVIEVRGMNLKGESFQMKMDGLLAICLQHEIDHLEGTLFIDHLSTVKSNKIKNQIKKHGYPSPKSVSEDDDGDLEMPKSKKKSKEEVIL